MKNFLALAAVALFLSACAQKEEQREAYKDATSVEHKRNAGVDSAAFSDPSQVKDSADVN